MLSQNVSDMPQNAYAGHEISGIASHFAMHILRFASQLHKLCNAIFVNNFVFNQAVTVVAS